MRRPNPKTAITLLLSFCVASLLGARTAQPSLGPCSSSPNKPGPCCCNNFPDVTAQFQRRLLDEPFCLNLDVYERDKMIDGYVIQFITALGDHPHTDHGCNKRKPTVTPLTQALHDEAEQERKHRHKSQSTDTVGDGDFPGGAEVLIYPEHQGCVRSKDAAAVSDKITAAFRAACGECGDGVIQEFEECDDGNLDNTDHCTNDCKAAICGDNITATVPVGPPGEEKEEECDDGNQDNTDNCTNACTIPAHTCPKCGDGVIQDIEECDDGNQDNADNCTNNCRLAICGDKRVQYTKGEECDDGNKINGDSCSNDCKINPASGGYLYGSPGLQASLADDIEADARRTSFRGGVGGGYFLRRGRFGLAAGLGLHDIALRVNPDSARCTTQDCTGVNELLLEAELRLGGGPENLFGYGLAGLGLGVGLSGGGNIPGFAAEIGGGVWAYLWQGLFIGGEGVATVLLFPGNLDAFHDDSRSLGVGFRTLIGWQFGRRVGRG